jgi:N-acetylglutamate synthase-like GNAT family acetyltransferase
MGQSVYQVAKSWVKSLDYFETTGFEPIQQNQVNVECRSF